MTNQVSGLFYLAQSHLGIGAGMLASPLTHRPVGANNGLSFSHILDLLNFYPRVSLLLQNLAECSHNMFIPTVVYFQTVAILKEKYYTTVIVH